MWRFLADFFGAWNGLFGNLKRKQWICNRIRSLPKTMSLNGENSPQKEKEKDFKNHWNFRPFSCRVACAAFLSRHCLSASSLSFLFSLTLNPSWFFHSAHQLNLRCDWSAAARLIRPGSCYKSILCTGK